MTPFLRLAVLLLEKLVGRWREGPEVPDRIVDEVDAFLVFVPDASRDEWVEFAKRSVANAYREGYARGFEASERTDRPWEHGVTPEFLADLEDPRWRDSPEVSLVD